MLGVLFALCSAATFALNNAGVRRGILSGSVLQAMAITVPLGVPLFLVATVLVSSLSDLPHLSTKMIAALSTAGILHFVWGRYWNYRTLRAIGLNLSALVLQVNLIITVMVAILFLNETLTPLRILGIALVLFGPALLLRSSAAQSSRPAQSAVRDERSDTNGIVQPGIAPRNNGVKASFKPRFLDGYVSALLSATGYGLSPIFIRLGLEDRSLATSFAGGLVAYSIATAVMVPFLLWPGNLRRVFEIKPEAAKWFTFSGVLVCVSQMFLFIALSIAPVTVVSPVSRLTLVFRLQFSRLLNPQHEIFGAEMVVGTVISLTGALVLSLTPDAIASLLPLPDHVVEMLKWHWPQH